MSPLRRLIRDAVWVNGTELFSRLANLVVSAGIARALGVDVLGEFTFAQVVLNLAMVGGDAGLGVRGAVRIGLGHDPAVVYRAIVARQALLTGAFVVIAVPVAALVAPLPLCLALAVVPLSHAVTANFVLLGAARYGELGVARGIGSVLMLPICGTGLILDDPVVVGLGYAVNGLAYAVAVNRLARLRITDLLTPDRAGGREGEPLTAMVMLAGVWYGSSLQLYSGSLIYVAQLTLDDRQFALIVVSWRILQLLTMPIVALESMLWNALSAGQQAHDYLRKILLGALVVGCLLASVMFFGASAILNGLYGVSSSEATAATMMLSLALPCQALASVLAAALLVRGRFVVVARSFAVGAVVVASTLVAFGRGSVLFAAASQFGGSVVLVVLLGLVVWARERTKKVKA